jgi:hypothetical protein
MQPADGSKVNNFNGRESHSQDGIEDGIAYGSRFGQGYSCTSAGINIDRNEVRFGPFTPENQHPNHLSQGLQSDQFLMQQQQRSMHQRQMPIPPHIIQTPPNNAMLPQFSDGGQFHIPAAHAHQSPTSSSSNPSPYTQSQSSFQSGHDEALELLQVLSTKTYCQSKTSATQFCSFYSSLLCTSA